MGWGGWGLFIVLKQDLSNGLLQRNVASSSVTRHEPRLLADVVQMS